MSSTPALDTPVIQEQPYKSHSGHGSIGPVIGALAVIMVLGAVAVMIGRLCSGRRVMGHLQYDFEGWVDNKCSSCIDGRLEPPPRRETVAVTVVESGGSTATATPATESPEIVAGEAPPQAEEESSHQQSQGQEQHSST